MLTVIARGCKLDGKQRAVQQSETGMARLTGKTPLYCTSSVDRARAWDRIKVWTVGHEMIKGLPVLQHYEPSSCRLIYAAASDRMPQRIAAQREVAKLGQNMLALLLKSAQVGH